MSKSIRIKIDPSRWYSIERWLATNKRELKLAMRSAMSVLHSQIHRNLSGPSHVRFPGNGNPFPGVLTGRMRNSINAKIRSGSDWIKGTVGPNVTYAAAHEFGHGHVPKRPYLTPAWKKQQKVVRKIIKDRINASLEARAV